MKQVAVTGMGILSPTGNDIPSYWDHLTHGRSGIDFIQGFDTEPLKVKVAAQVKGFDPLAYMDKAEVRRSDLYTQYALAAAAQAMADSNPRANPERFGVYVGSGIGGIQTFMDQAQRLLEKGPGKVSPFFIPMLIGNMAAGSIAIRYRAQGPNLSVVTACATSTHAIGEALRAIQGGHADVIIAGGAEAAISPIGIAGFTSCMALSTRNDPARSSIPFDVRRDGFVMGEGAAMLVLEEYGRARARGATIYALISGYANTCDAYHITAPHPEGAGAAAALSLALREAGHAPGDALYINAHGTSTPLNDRVETMAIKHALGQAAYGALISSSKSMTGHMLGAAGAAEAIAAILALRTGIVPPTIGLEQPDPECDLDYVPNTARAFAPTLALSLSMGFGGHNACLAFAPAPPA